jgi:hypothetical protein
MRSDIWRRRIGSASNFSFLVERQRMALSGHMKWNMMFENREGHWRGSARLRLGKIRLRAADGPEKLERFWQKCHWARPSKGGNRDYGRLLVRCPRKEGVRVTVTALTYRCLYSRDKCR